MCDDASLNIFDHLFFVKVCSWIMSVLRFGRVVLISQKNQLIRGISSTSDSKLVLIDINEKNGIATLSLNRHPANSFNLDLLNAFDNALRELEINKPRGMILTSVCIIIRFEQFLSIYFRLFQKYSRSDLTSVNYFNLIQYAFENFGGKHRIAGWSCMVLIIQLQVLSTDTTQRVCISYLN